MASSEQKRLFVGNLPPDIQEHEIKTEFSYYGPVNKVEIKQKKATDTDEVQSSFAFVTITIDENALRQCLQEFKSQQYRGRYLQVTVARENFLEKLKREREEAAQFKKPSTSQSKNTDAEIVNAVLPTISTGNSDESDESSSDESSEEESVNHNASVTKQNGAKKFKSSTESSDSSDSDREKDPDNLVLRKKSKIFLENGKIKIDRTVSTGEAIHVIESKPQKMNKKELDEKSKLADQKRLESLKKMKNSYNEQKQAIKKALAGVDVAKKSNKIVFDDDDEDDDNDIGRKSNRAAKNPSESNQKELNPPTKKPKLFDENDSDGEQDFEGNFEIKKQFEGIRGEKLRRLQDRFQGDNRFKLDSRFLEDNDSDGGENDHITQRHSEKKSNEETTENIETNESDERQWQMNILESVIGKRIQSTSKSKETQKKAAPSMLRFDPTRAEHTKFVEPKVKKRKTKAVSEPETKRQKLDSDNHEEDQPIEPINDEPPVSMEHFYEVRGDLKKSLGSGGFSLLSMFNRPADDDDNADTPVAVAEKPYEEKSINKNGVKFLADFDPFKYDSSGDEADDNKSKKTSQKIETDTKKSDIKYESFFQLSSTDERISEGLAMFKSPEGAEIENPDANDYDDAKRQELKNIVKRKMKKSLQNALPRNVKPNKRFKRFAKNL